MTELGRIKEQLLSRGPRSLEVWELLAVLLDDRGFPSPEAVAKNLLEFSSGSLYRLAGMEVRKLRTVEGMGVRRAAVIAATLELGKRLGLESEGTPSVIRHNEDVIEMFRPRIANLRYEEFWAVYLSGANSVLETAKISQGGATGTVVDAKIVVKRALELLASGIIMVHNHPSGIARPSQDDLILTERIRVAAEVFDIKIVDHLIVTTGDCFSFRGNGLFENPEGARL